MIYYKVIGGSRCYGVELDTSDIDICCVSDIFNTTSHYGKCHLIQVPRSEFVDRAMLLKENPLYIQWLYPYRVLSQGDICEYINTIRDDVVYMSRDRLWDQHMECARRGALYPEHYYFRFPKRIAYSTLFYNILSRYASGVPFKDAMMPEENMREIIIAMRKSDISLEEAVLINKEERNKAMQYEQWYQSNTSKNGLGTIYNSLCSLLYI